MLRAMSDSRQALFQAVLDRPDDDAPRIQLAEFLEAQGDPYGAFIRTQLARTHALRHGSDDDANRLREEARQLRYDHRTPEWTNGVEKLGANPEFVRGFVDRIIVDARTYLDHADEFYRRAPIRQLVLTAVGDLVDTLVRDSRLTRITWLTIEGKPMIGDAGLTAIAASPHLRNLRVLAVGQQDIGTAGLEALCASKQLPSLVYANVVGNRFEDPIEGYGTDWATGRIVADGIYLSPFGKELERKYGALAWLHGPSRLRHFPPYADEF
jgi:uncharacterized protein (TIGR02996 family)